MTGPLFGFTDDSIVLRGSAYHGVLDQPALKDLWTVTSIHYLCMKFPTEHGIAISETFPVNPEDPTQVLRIGKALPPGMKEEMMNFLKRNLDVFTWKHEDMLGIDPRISCHHLNINFSCAPHRQKRRALNSELYEALKEEINKLIRSGFIRESIYPKWISNPVLVKKSSGKWKVCEDFTNLNKACPKDIFPLPRIRIDQLVDSTAGHELLSFMDAYLGYNQIPMFRPDEESTSFITDKIVLL
ncbi:uncharacterized protein LOC111411539 [Olea europaea var. sylvestris]|uniref:uncharacterized protein LOC111411539 n=1 Tax=Olea europaea var. sylvestris TaxID=158386 RepID=UPI000C1CF14D|nr:uncharacterized protein LOC111411539 [Olea europaea var. sylvestris]